jgi:hypothetical protein
MAKEPLPPRSVIQCAVASTLLPTGSGLASRMVLLTPPGSCCSYLDELGAILLRIGQSVKHFYLTPVAIVICQLPDRDGIIPLGTQCGV